MVTKEVEFSKIYLKKSRLIFKEKYVRSTFRVRHKLLFVVHSHKREIYFKKILLTPFYGENTLYLRQKMI